MQVTLIVALSILSNKRTDTLLSLFREPSSTSNECKGNYGLPVTRFEPMWLAIFKLLVQITLGHATTETVAYIQGYINGNSSQIFHYRLITDM